MEIETRNVIPKPFPDWMREKYKEDAWRIHDYVRAEVAFRFAHAHRASLEEIRKNYESLVVQWQKECLKQKNLNLLLKSQNERLKEKLKWNWTTRLSLWWKIKRRQALLLFRSYM